MANSYVDRDPIPVASISSLKTHAATYRLKISIIGNSTDGYEVKSNFPVNISADEFLGAFLVATEGEEDLGAVTSSCIITKVTKGVNYIIIYSDPLVLYYVPDTGMVYLEYGDIPID